jgi:hypothetical protein
MMPIYFNAESHLWIAYLLFFNGLLLTWCLRSVSTLFHQLTRPLEGQIISAFFLSLAFNGLLLLAFDRLALQFSSALIPLVVVSFTLVCLIFVFRVRLRDSLALSFEISWPRVALYAFVFVMLFYNGGLIEQIADSWWHMSLANKLALESSYSTSIGHLTGLETRYYPPLWHANLALMKTLSGISVSVFWNSFTAWGAVLKVMAFYLLSLRLCNNTKIAMLAALLFILLPGVGVSYLRVSAWPSHIAYTAWFVMFYLVFAMFDKLPTSDEGIKQGLVDFISKCIAPIIAIFVLGIIIFYTHQAEILWFVVAMFCYLATASVSRLGSSKSGYIADRDHIVLRASYLIGLSLLLIVSVWFAITHKYPVFGFSDRLISNVLPISILLVLFSIELKFVPKAVNLLLAIGLAAVLLISINYTHLYSLFDPAYALPKGLFFQSSSVAIGYFGGELKVPNWQLQLRSGLLYSGFLSVIFSSIAVYLKPTRATLFLSGSSLIALLFCASPYLYHWLQSILAYHSPWRITLIVFHPILWALLISGLFDVAKGGHKNETTI